MSKKKPAIRHQREFLYVFNARPETQVQAVQQQKHDTERGQIDKQKSLDVEALRWRLISELKEFGC